MSQSTPMNRSSGVLLHPTSLPSPYGVGDLGPAAYAWVDALVRAKQKWWQILPLGPTGYGDSPYSSFSAFAGNPALISPGFLVRDGLLDEDQLPDTEFSSDQIDYGAVIRFKLGMLERAWDNFQAGHAPALKPDYETFCWQQAGWLDDYALFMAIRNAQNAAMADWPARLLRRDKEAMTDARRELGQSVGMHEFGQFLFFRQWRELKKYANDHGVHIIGDVPIFISNDSADVWAIPEIFMLDKACRPTVVAGVPPDYFSETGQLWGNPLYNWEKLKETKYAWWVARLKATLKQVDLARLDHFRGFESYWEVPAGMPTAEKGRWVKGPGIELFDAVRQSLGGLPLIAEDLGTITKEVDALREKLGIPGMRVLQFAFGGDPANQYLPHHYDRDTIVYTGTHDNDTTRGWYGTLPDGDADFVRRYLARDGSDVAWDFIRLAWGSVADYAIVPLQDVLNLDSEARLNFPGQPMGNWTWRFLPEMLTDGVVDGLAGLTEMYSRC